ncbi:GDP-L-fucose synthase [Candidatus Methanoperedenaceae archaeon GB50]|nr:GDP-L-fucose synthase [Candidatus Methanoperedenaceae archaeon GB37]CAD7777353.1 GDP-L-fucose synthase [Candidatus Methanoperedenaceae archaeon GB50]
MKCFVTGGAGFIGSHLVDSLLASRCNVTVYDNFVSGRHNFIAHHRENPNFRLVEGDLLNRELLADSIKDHEFVFHLAANPDIRKSTADTRLDLEQGIIATFNVLEAMRKEGIRQISFTSTSTVYGEARVIPTPEDYGPLTPISLYGASKLGAEALISSYCGSFGMQAWIFRFANIVGSRSTHGIIYDFIQKLRENPHELEILGDGRQKKSYLLVEECVNAMLHAITRSDESVNIFNLGAEDSTEVTTIAEIVTEELGLDDVAFRYTGGERGWTGDVPRFLLSIKKIKELGWKPEHTSDQAIRRATKIMIKELTENQT